MLWLIARPSRLVGLLVLAALAGGVFWLWQQARSSTPAGEAGALRDFRERGGDAGVRARGQPKPGLYAYRSEGEESGSIGPASLTRRLPDRALFIVTLTSEGYIEELRLSEEHIETVHYATPAGASKATRRRTRFSVLGIGRDDRRDLVPHPLVMPATFRVGQTWSNTYMAGSLEITSEHRVVSEGTVRVGGRREPVFVVRVDGVTSGLFGGTRVDTLWWSPRLSMPMRWRIDMDVSGVASIRTAVELTLVDTTPAV